MSRVTEAPTLEELRKETLAELESALGSQTIGSEEYRQRAEVARRATDETELDSVRPPRRASAAPSPSRAPSSAPGRRTSIPRLPAGDETGLVFACMGGSVRKGPWEPPETLYCLALMGGVELDFREAALLEGTTDVVVLALMGGTKIVVPDDVDVEVSGIGIMGGFEHVSNHAPGGIRPLIRIKGLALMGGVEVKVKPPRQSRTAKRGRHRT